MRRAHVLCASCVRTSIARLCLQSQHASSRRVRPAALCVAQRFIVRVGQTLNGPAQSEVAHPDDVTVETVRVPSGVTTITRRKTKPRTFVNADGYNVVEEDADSAQAVSSASSGTEDAVAEFTVTEGEHLEKLFRKPVVSHKYLSKSESAMLSKLLFDACYKDELNGTNKEALLYQASLELIWLEEWADGLLKRAKSHKEGAGEDAEAPRPPVHTAEDVRRLIKKSVLERVDLQKPLSYIIGSQPFFGCDILCRPPLLCPRPETEMWTHWLVSKHLSAVARSASASTASPAHSHAHAATEACTPCHDTATKAPRPLRVLDMCAGTGCIGVAIAKHVPCAEVISVDLLDEAVMMTRRNATHNNIPSTRLQAVKSDLFAHFLEPTEGHHPTGAHPTPGEGGDRRVRTRVKPEYRHAFDLIVSNPPYVLPEQYINLPRTITHWESKMALVGDDAREHKQYLYFQDLCEYGRQLLKKPDERHPALREAPSIVIEVGLQAHLVASLMEKSGWFKNVELHLDYAGQDRWISATSI